MVECFKGNQANSSSYREREKEEDPPEEKNKKQSINSKIEQYTILGLLKDFGDFQELYRIVRER